MMNNTSRKLLTLFGNLRLGVVGAELSAPVPAQRGAKAV
jgi:hypothetical protein